MNKIGKVYQVKWWWWWLVFPNKEDGFMRQSHESVDLRSTPPPSGMGHGDALLSAAYYRKYYGCNVTVVSPNDFVVLLETDGQGKKVLSCNGDIGWIWINKNDDHYFEEISE